MALTGRTRYKGSMIAALVNGLVGLGICLGIGLNLLHMGIGDIFISVLASNLASLLSLLVTLHAERIPWIKENILNRSLKTWGLLSCSYLGLLICLAPPLRQSPHFFYLLAPLVLSTGFAILLFGPIQDFLVRRQQRKTIMAS